MKHHDRWTIKRSTRSMLWGSALAMLISCALFAGATYAWFFDDNCSASVATVTTADYFGVNVVKESESESEQDTKMLPTSGAYNLSAGKYTVTLTWVGDETTRGYYIIGIGDENKENVQYYSPNLTAETTTVSFQLVITEQNSATLTPVWSGVAGGLVVTTIDSRDTISYPARNAASTNEEEPVTPVSENQLSDPAGQSETGGSDNGTSETPEPGTGEGSTGNGNLPEGEPTGSGSLDPETGENAGVGGSSGDVPLTSETNENANGNALENQ